MNAPFLGAYKTIYSSNSRTKLTFVVIKIKSFHRDSSENFTKKGNNMVCLQLEPLTNRIRTKIENWYFDPKLRIYAFQKKKNNVYLFELKLVFDSNTLKAAKAPISLCAELSNLLNFIFHILNAIV